MSPVGHSIVGMALATVAIPKGTPIRGWVFGMAVFVAIASLPDWPLHYWGHDWYKYSHSLPVSLVLIMLS